MAQVRFFSSSSTILLREQRLIGEMKTVIGIDLGTTYSCVGVMQKGKVEILVNDQGHRITPSYVAFTDEERLVGDAAKNQAAANPKRTIFDIK
jgi:endoplasmic reticulum chaperone BiP